MKVASGICILFLTAAFLGSCDSYQKVQKSNDPYYKLDKAKEYYEEGKYYQALPLFEELIAVFRGDTMLETVYYYYCYTLYGQGAYLIAAQSFKYFSSSFPNSNRKEEMMWQHAMSYLALSPHPDLDQTHTHKAIDALQLFVNLYPDSERVSEANGHVDSLWAKLEIKDFNSAMLYFDRGQYKAASKSFEVLLEEYPASRHTENMHLMWVRSLNLLAINSIPSLQEERYQASIEACDDFARQYPESKFIDDVQDMKKKSFRSLNTQP